MIACGSILARLLSLTDTRNMDVKNTQPYGVERMVAISNLKVTVEERKAGIIQKCWHDPEEDLYICLVDLNKCNPDPTYQRPHDTGHSDRLLSKDLGFCPYPVTSFRAKRVNTVDGQHRNEKRKKQKKKTGYVFMKFGLSLQREAQIYDELNNSKRRNAWNCFNAKIVGGDKDAKEQKELANKYGFTLQCEGGNRPDLKNTCPIVESYRANLYESWLKILQCFLDEDDRLDKIARGGEFQRGVVDVLRKFNGTLTTTRVLNAFKQIGTHAIKREADVLCGCSSTNRNHYADAIHDLLSYRGLVPARTPLKKAA